MMVDVNIVTLNAILEALESQAFSNLHELYAIELSRMLQHAQSAKEPMISLTGPTFRGPQAVINFNVSDKSKPIEDKVNWHGQNTSQWIYAGALVYDQKDGTWSAHH